MSSVVEHSSANAEHGVTGKTYNLKKKHTKKQNFGDCLGNVSA